MVSRAFLVSFATKYKIKSDHESFQDQWKVRIKPHIFINSSAFSSEHYGYVHDLICQIIIWPTK
jgi:hypothetical protein